MKSRELDNRVKRAGAEFLYQDASSHKYYNFSASHIMALKKYQQVHATEF